MNAIRRAINAERKRFLSLPPIFLIQQQHASSSSTTIRTLRTLKTSKPKATIVKSQLEPEPSTTSSSLNGSVPDEPVSWPKPSEIPWQPKVVNSVNLIGQVKIPVQFETSSDGKDWAGTIISQEDGSDFSTSPPSFWIPVIFEGDMAHTAICHLREKDYVHVAGHLSVDVPPLKLSGGQANVQVMAHSINFVQGHPQGKKKISRCKLEERTANNSAIVENNIPMQQSLKKFDSRSNQPGKFPKLLDVDESTPDLYIEEVEDLYSNHKVDMKNTGATWRDLLANPKEWLDNRENKRKGLVKVNYPDFKHKDTGVGLWLDKAPEVVLQGLRLLEFDVPPSKGEKSSHFPPSKGEKDIDGDPWKHLGENPDKWWDNRNNKKSQRGPDFKHKDSGKALWLGDAPAWVKSSLPPLTPKKKTWAL